MQIAMTLAGDIFVRTNIIGGNDAGYIYKKSPHADSLVQLLPNQIKDATIVSVRGGDILLGCKQAGLFRYAGDTLTRIGLPGGEQFPKIIKFDSTGTIFVQNFSLGLTQPPLQYSFDGGATWESDSISLAIPSNNPIASNSKGALFTFDVSHILRSTENGRNWDTVLGKGNVGSFMVFDVFITSKDLLIASLQLWNAVTVKNHGAVTAFQS